MKVVPDANDLHRDQGVDALRDRHDGAHQYRGKRLIIPSRDFVTGFTPPDYLVDGILQRGFIYSLTAPTGWAKTAIALHLSASTALGTSIGDHPVEKGRVVYLAGENPDDIRMRWIAMSDRLAFDTSKIDVHFIPGVFKISELFGRVEKEVRELGGTALIIVDTSAAYFEGEAENDNTQMGAHGRMLRRLTTLPGKPCVITCCHPPKGATSKEAMLPRGGGAFIAEIDGNLICAKKDSIVELHWVGKFRAPDFEPITFQIQMVGRAPS